MQLKNAPRKMYSFLKVKLRQSMTFVQCTVLANSSNQIAGPGVTIYRMQVIS